MSSGFAKAKLIMSCSLAPYHINDPKSGLQNQLNQMLMKYCEPVKGVLLAFNTLQVVNPYGHIINETPYIHVRVAANALVFRPTPGMLLTATVNKIGSNHIGLLLAGVFNVSISANEMPIGYVHNYHEGAWIGEDGTTISIDENVRFKVLRVHVAHGVISIDGSMRSLDEKNTTPQIESPVKKDVVKSPKKSKRKQVVFADEVEEKDAAKRIKKESVRDEVKEEFDSKAKKSKKAKKADN